tara:strand:+ start:313 stop:984 length:672 start_codon:yes stop_codon:yes gene_type:complete
MKFAVIVFPGSNCDHDAYYVLNKILNVHVDFIWHKESTLSDYDAILLPGGFSYGDYLRTGAIAKYSPIMKEVIRNIDKGVPVIGICNGFQILIEAGILPGFLIKNKNTKFISKMVHLDVLTNQSIFTKLLEPDKTISMPIAHGEGNYQATQDTLLELQDNDCIAFKYSEENNTIGNPNGSIDNIAGILNKRKNVLGMMPHPERACESILGSDQGINIFKSMLS